MSDIQIKNILDRGVTDVIIRSELEKKLKSEKKLRIKFGIDPTGSDLHLGHAVVLNKLKHFQDAGHTCILLIGDYTARIGDPTGKSETRKMLSEADIRKNMQDYINQASKILDIDKLEIRHNSEWYGKMNMAEILELTSKRTVNQMLQREDFKNRINSGREVSVVEMMYPLMQGYDSVALDCDVEIGGTDQLFNMLVGRDLQKIYECKKQQNVITVPILEGLDGKEKMSKSLNNYIGLTESPKEIYGKTLSLPDELIVKYFKLATHLPLDQISTIEDQMKSGENPKNFKMQLAKELVSFYHDRNSAEAAEQEFQNIFAKGQIPTDIEEINLEKPNYNTVDLIVEAQLLTSKSEARRMVQQGAVKINDEKIEDINQEISITEKTLIKVGKRK